MPDIEFIRNRPAALLPSRRSDKYILPFTIVATHPDEMCVPDLALDWPAWSFDTGFNGDGVVSPEFLAKEFALRAPDWSDKKGSDQIRQSPGVALPYNGAVDLHSTAVGAGSKAHQYRAKFWFRGEPDLPPLPVVLPTGVNVLSSCETPLLGVRPFLGKPIRVQINYSTSPPRFSVWIDEAFLLAASSATG